MFSVRIGKNYHTMKSWKESILDVSFDRDHLDLYTERNPNNHLVGTRPKSFLSKIAQIRINVESETLGGNKPSTLVVSLSISEARDLAEQLLKNARETEAYINEIGQDG